MLTNKSLIRNLIDVQNKINENLVGLREDLKPKWDGISVLNNSITSINTSVSSIISDINTNIYTKKQTLDAIAKEYDYRKDYEKCLEENADLLHMIEKYFKCENKYDVLKVFKEINKDYIVREINKGRKHEK